MSNDQHVSLDGVEAIYAGGRSPLTALQGINLSIRRGEFVSVIGPSGCGKSTLLRIVGGLQEPTNGRVLIDGSPPKVAQRSKDIGFVFQTPSLLPWRRVLANVTLPLEVNDRATAQSAESLVELVGLLDFAEYYPHQLSGGMQQRVALARALVTDPELLLMDEPFGSLDEITRSSMRFELLRVWSSRAEETPSTVLFITHSIPEALLLSDRVVVLTSQPGRIAAVVDVEIERPRGQEVEFEPLFLEKARQIRALLTEYSLL